MISLSGKSAELKRSVTEAEHELWSLRGRRLAAEVEESEAELRLEALQREYETARDHDARPAL